MRENIRANWLMNIRRERDEAIDNLELAVRRSLADVAVRPEAGLPYGRTQPSRDWVTGGPGIIAIGSFMSCGTASASDH
jgi:hypothetical protein